MWTEFFFDRVFLAAVARGHALHTDVSLRGAVAFAGPFVPVRWTWTTFAM